MRAFTSSSVCLSLSGLALLALPLAGQAATRNVPSAFSNIQAAINAAVNGDTIMLGPGIYSGAGNVNIDTMGKAITIKSSAGSGSTILQANFTNPYFNIHSGETKTTKIQGLTFRYGFALSGGAMTISNSSPSISGCVFEQNYASSGAGGAISVSGGAPTISACTFYENGTEANYGGALALSGDKSVVSNCTFDSNQAYSGYYGGALYAYAGSTAKFSNSLFENNQAAGGDGGAALISGASPSFSNCTFSENKAANSGGAFMALNSSSKLNCCVFDTNSCTNGYGGALYLSQSANFSVINCDFSSNAGYTGGAVYTDGSNPSFTGCEFDFNSASSPYRFTGGGAIYIAPNSGGGIPKITDCEFYGNTAIDGGAVSSLNTAVISASVFTSNNANSDGGAVISLSNNFSMVNDIFLYNSATNGGAVSLEPGNGGYLYMTNCSTYGNSAASGGYGNGVYVGGSSSGLTIYNTILWDAGSGNSEVWDALHITNISYSDVYGVWTGAGTHTFTSDPLYTDPTHYNLLPQTASVCNNTGSPTAPQFPKTDIDGVTRSTTAPDIGAYEF